MMHGYDGKEAVYQLAVRRLLGAQGQWLPSGCPLCFSAYLGSDRIPPLNLISIHETAENFLDERRASLHLRVVHI